MLFLCKITKKVDIVKTLIGLITIGLAIYSTVNERKKASPSAKKASAGPARPAATSRPAKAAASQLPPRPPRQVRMPALAVMAAPAMAMPEEGERVTSDIPGDLTSSSPATEPEDDGLDSLRSAVIWGEILNRKF